MLKVFIKFSIWDTWKAKHQLERTTIWPDQTKPNQTRRDMIITVIIIMATQNV